MTLEELKWKLVSLTYELRLMLDDADKALDENTQQDMWVGTVDKYPFDEQQAIRCDDILHSISQRAIEGNNLVVKYIRERDKEWRARQGLDK